ncbi:hypothetical protein [Paraconexibacter sp.]|uniref:hypothetical protein n=1 Tax=Paraconexibacter sp. TaxID=2949640 RepID=UPI00356AFFCE
MSDTGIFMIGLIITLVLGGALWMLVWAAVQDGKVQEEFEQAKDASAEPEQLLGNPARR